MLRLGLRIQEGWIVLRIAVILVMDVRHPVEVVEKRRPVSIGVRSHRGVIRIPQFHMHIPRPVLISVLVSVSLDSLCSPRMSSYIVYQSILHLDQSIHRLFLFHVVFECQTSRCGIDASLTFGCIPRETYHGEWTPVVLDRVPARDCWE